MIERALFVEQYDTSFVDATAKEAKHHIWESSIKYHDDIAKSGRYKNMVRNHKHEALYTYI